MNIQIYKSVIFPAVLYGRETLSLQLKEEQAEGYSAQGAKENI
jgi:hypothetical protein